jgi:hypothetical protein
MSKSKLEEEVKKDIKKLLKQLDAWQYMPVPNGFGMQGVPDHIACVPLEITGDMVGAKIGVFVGIEAKRLGKSPTTHQQLQLDKIRDARGLAFVIKGTESEDGTFSTVKRTLMSFFRKLEGS